MKCQGCGGRRGCVVIPIGCLLSSSVIVLLSGLTSRPAALGTKSRVAPVGARLFEASLGGRMDLAVGQRGITVLDRKTWQSVAVVARRGGSGGQR